MTSAVSTWIGPAQLRELAQAHLDGLASDDDIALLEEREDEWVAALEALRRSVQTRLERVSRDVTGPERPLVIADFVEERARIDGMLSELTGEAPSDDGTPDGRLAAGSQDGQNRDGQASAPGGHSTDEQDDRGARGAADHRDHRGGDRHTGSAATEQPAAAVVAPGARLQLSWHAGRVIAWSAGPSSEPETEERLRERLQAAGAPASSWAPHEAITLPDDSTAPALAAPVQATLGWLVSPDASTPTPVGEDAGEDESPGVSVAWLSRAATLAVRLVAQGRMVPQLQRLPDGSAKGRKSSYGVRWKPALIDRDELTALSRSLPGTVTVLDAQADPVAMTHDVVASFVDAICRDAAGRVEVPAPPPQPNSASDVAETVLGRLDGSAFDAPTPFGNEIAGSLQAWTKGITGATDVQLVVHLDQPDDGGAWHLRTLTPGRRGDETVEAAMSRAKHQRKEAIKRELERLEELYEPLMRGKQRRRGQVILDQDEAWDLMTSAGPALVAAGFDVRVPPLSRRKASPSLRVTSTAESETSVGAGKLTAVRWSAVFGDVELTAADIARLANESRPLVRSHGRWVEVDKVDLEAAAAALAERADRTKMTGAEMLRYALGLEGSALGGAVSVAGRNWAAELLRSASEIPDQPSASPSGFAGELRSYQANALAWLDFLHGAGLGGCLALDMGLGKTPVMLAHLRERAGDGPALVIAPPAVVGNWASEAQRFVPDLRVVVHHGQNRADEGELAEEIAAADVLLTTYGTAVRDIDALADVEWNSVVLDEAQVIKNPASETAQQLRRLEARTRVVLTGTPIENGLGDLWALLDFVNPGLVGDRATFVAQLSKAGEGGSAERALRTLNGVLVFRRTKAEPVIAAELPDRIDELDHCPMTPEQVGLYQAVLDQLVAETAGDDEPTKKKGAVLAAITALKQICNHPAAYTRDGGPLAGRSGKLARLEEIVDSVFEAGERMLIFTHFATWGTELADHLSARTGVPVACYHGGLSRTARDEMVRQFQDGDGAGALVLSLKAGGTGLNLTAAGHVVLYDRWWNPAVEDQARDRVWRIGQTKTVVCHRLVCPGTVDERVEEVVAGKRRIADIALPKSSSVGDLDSEQLGRALGLDPDTLLTEDSDTTLSTENAA